MSRPDHDLTRRTNQRLKRSALIRNKSGRTRDHVGASPKREFYVGILAMFTEKAT